MGPIEVVAFFDKMFLFFELTRVVDVGTVAVGAKAVNVAEGVLARNRVNGNETSAIVPNITNEKRVT